MANTFRPQPKDIPVEENPLESPKPKKEFSAPKQKKPKNPAYKTIRKSFNLVFGAGLLKNIDFAKHKYYFLMLISLIIVLIYNSLNMQSKKMKIEKLKEEIVNANDELMNAIEEGYAIDNVQDKELFELAKEEGFINKGYIPYIIKDDKNKNQYAE